MTDHATSADGTSLAYDVVGDGSPAVLVPGMFCTRHTLAPLAEALAATGHTAVTYDRRGRGDSGGAGPVPPPSEAVTREVEDLAAVVAAVGGSAALYGHSSGAGLVAHGAAAGVPVTRLVLHEPPWGTDSPEQTASSRELAALIDADLAAGRPSDAIRRFLGPMGMPPDMLDGAASDPDMQAVAPTMPYDLAVMGDAAGGALPVDLVASIAVPTLVVVGDASGDFFRTTADRLAALVPGAELAVLPGADHGAPAEVVAPVVDRFLSARG